jgi:hypothetical protein
VLPRATASFRPGLVLRAAIHVLTAAALWPHVPASAANDVEQGRPRIVAEWTFDRDGDMQGWQPNSHLTGVTVTNGVLACRAVGSDPILELRPLLDLPTSPWQMIEVRLRSSQSGPCEFFWSNTTQGRYGGFSQDKTTRFQVDGDGQWHTYRLLPFWHRERKLVRLRLDVYDGTSFTVDFIRVLELAMPPPASRAEFDFTRGLQGWQVVGDGSCRSTPKGLAMTLSNTEAFLLSPPLQVRADGQSFVSVQVAAQNESAALPREFTLFFATDQAPGLHTLRVPDTGGAAERLYNLDMLAVPGWRGRVMALGLRTSHGTGAAACLRSLRISDDPQGPPQLDPVSFALEDAAPRAGAPSTLRAIVSNTGGTTATNLQAKLGLPGEIQLLSATPTNSWVARLGAGEEAEFRWRVRAAKPLTGTATLQLIADNGSRADLGTPLAFSAELGLPKAAYVPEPKPVRGECEVGAYYFPGWKSASQWHPLQRFPERRPVLGWYHEGDPEVADWHIKWAVEHGITFFAYDWYWSQGARQLEHALHDGYFKARYRHLLKFCLLWANHNAPRTSSLEDCVAVTRYWIELYFRRPEHLTIDGKPVMIIFSPHRLTEDLTSDGVKRAFEAMRAECQRAGLKGLHLVACVGDVGGARQAATEGYDAVTAYNWPSLGMTGGSGMYAPFEALLGGYRRHWEHLLGQSPIPLSPLPICGGWDSRPWHGDNNLVRFGRTPELFKRHLQDAEQLLETRNPKLGTRNLVLIEAWNEWGEGSYIEPHREFGFGYLDAIRDVFTVAPRRHTDLTPPDVGLGPYDVPPPEPSRTAWDFERDEEGWNNTMDLADVKSAGGVLAARTTGRDPAFFGPPIQIQASEFGSVVLRMKLERTGNQPLSDTAQLFWRTSRLPESEASSARFAVTADGQWHDCQVDVGRNPRWRGVITRLRLDPCNQPKVGVAIDSICLVP